MSLCKTNEFKATNIIFISFGFYTFIGGNLISHIISYVLNLQVVFQCKTQFKFSTGPHEITSKESSELMFSLILLVLKLYESVGFLSMSSA